MKTTITRVKSNEPTILTAMVVNDRVLARIAPHWDKEEGLFKSKPYNIIGNWCVKYFRKTGKAPRKHIFNLYQQWAEQADPDSATLIEKFLENLSAEYAQAKRDINAEYVIDLSASTFDYNRLSRLAHAILGDLDSNASNSALERLTKFKKLELGVGAPVDLLKDHTRVKEILDDSRDVLFRYPGALGNFFGDSIEREGFLAFLGPEKRGKTFWLLDMAWRAITKRLKVAFFEIGDLSERQIMKRFYSRAVKRPLKRTRPDRPLQLPKEMYEGDEGWEVKAKPIHYIQGATDAQVIRALKRYDEKYGKKGSLLKLSVHPNSSISVQGLRSLLQEWEANDGWTPDLLDVDYADIAAAPPGFKGESRDAVNETWKAFRRASQELRCCVVTATQANAASYKSDQLGMENFSEDKRKFSHVTGMIGLNQNSTNKEKNIIRLNWLVLREDEFSVEKEVYCAQCLPISNPAVLSAGF